MAHRATSGTDRAGAPEASALPSVFHFVWLGSDVPSWATEYMQTWSRNFPNWKQCLWTDDHDLPLINYNLYRNASKLAPGHEGQFKSDLLRYELLYRYGGIYVDTDFECRKNFEHLLDGVDCFAAWEEQDRWVNNALMGATPGHPFIEALIQGLASNVQQHQGYRPNVLTGPQYVTRLYNHFKGDVQVFPQRLFYPYSYHEVESASLNADTYPWAFAVHHWNNKRKRLGRGL